MVKGLWTEAQGHKSLKAIERSFRGFWLGGYANRGGETSLGDRLVAPSMRNQYSKRIKTGSWKFLENKPVVRYLHFLEYKLLLELAGVRRAESVRWGKRSKRRMKVG